MVTTTKVAVSLRVAASLLGVHYRTLKRYAARGRLPTYWSGNTEMVTMETVARIQRGELTLRPPHGAPAHLATARRAGAVCAEGWTR